MYLTLYPQLHTITAYYIGNNRLTSRINIPVDRYAFRPSIDLPHLEECFAHPKIVHMYMVRVLARGWMIFRASVTNDEADGSSNGIEAVVFKCISQNTRQFTSLEGNDPPSLPETIAR